MADSAREARHRDPVWRDRADFIIGAILDDCQGTEQLFARQLGPHRFELCCIPFFTYGLALGDVVETNNDYTISRVVEASGHRTIRVWLGDTFLSREGLVESARALGAEVEWSSTNLVALSAPDDGVTSGQIIDHLDRSTADGLTWEFG